MSDFQYVPGGVLKKMPPPPAAPAPAARTNTNWPLISEQLKADPGEWYLLAIGQHTLMQQTRITKGRTNIWKPPGAFDATLRKIDGEMHLFGCYVGPTDVSKAPDFQYFPGGALKKMLPQSVARALSGRSSTNWLLISEQLKADPGEWYLLAIGQHTLMQQNRIVKGRIRFWEPAGTFDATLRKIDGEVHLFGRYVGPPEATDVP